MKRLSRLQALRIATKAKERLALYNPALSEEEIDRQAARAVRREARRRAG